MKTKMLLLLSSFCLCGCLSGNMLRGRYYAPDERFSFEAPYLVNPGAKIEDQYSADFGRRPENDRADIFFTDDFGKFLRVNLMGIPADFSREVPEKQVLEATRLYLLDLYKKYQPDAKVLHQEFFDYQGKPADFFVVEMKNGSVLADGSGNRFYAKRSSVTFVRGQYVYIFTKLFSDSNPLADKLQSNAQMKAEILKVTDTLKIKGEQE